MELAEETVRVQGGKTRPRTLAYLVFTGLKSSTSCVIFQECPMALCLLAPFWEGSKGRTTTAPPWEAREGHTGPKPPGERLCGRFGPQVGDGPVPARSGAIWAPQGPVWQKEKKPPPLPVGGEFGGVILKQVKGPGSLERPQPGHLARQSRSFRAFCPVPQQEKSGVGWEALESRPGSETRNFPAASHFSGCHRRGQRKDEEKIWQIKI